MFTTLIKIVTGPTWEVIWISKSHLPKIKIRAAGLVLSVSDDKARLTLMTLLSLKTYPTPSGRMSSAGGCWRSWDRGYPAWAGLGASCPTNLVWPETLGTMGSMGKPMSIMAFIMGTDSPRKKQFPKLLSTIQETESISSSVSTTSNESKG